MSKLFKNIYHIEELNTLPPSMKIRAIWARETILNHPELAEIDEDELLAWVYHNEDKVWYSIAGNYSNISPKDKMEKRRKYKERQLQIEKQIEENMNIFLDESKIRQMVLDRDNYICQICGKQGSSKFHIHHVLKSKEDGTMHLDNLLTVCPNCHKKADTQLYNPEWIGKTRLNKNG